MNKISFFSLLFLMLLLASCLTADDDSTINETTAQGFALNSYDFKGIISNESITLDPSLIYNLTGSVQVKNGGILNIPAGTVIKATGGTSSYIAVSQNSKIYISGTANNPVVMTSGQSSPAAGDWGGLVVCGNAPTNKGVSATAEVSDMTYGGTDSQDSSGSIRYLRVEYTGATFNGSKEFNGVSLFGVGNRTTFEYVQSYNGGDDGIEFFGGSVSGKYLVATNSGDDSIDFADGWTGSGEKWFISGGIKAGIEGSNNGDNPSMTPMTTTHLKDITIIGPGTEGGLYIKEGGGNWTIDNLYIANYDLGIKIKDKSADPVANSHVLNGNITLNTLFFDTVSDENDYKGPNQFYNLGNATGAGNGKSVPSWAQGWTVGL